MSNKLKELETQYKAIKPPEEDVSYGVRFKVDPTGLLKIEVINATYLQLDADQAQAVFNYLKGLGYT